MGLLRPRTGLKDMTLAVNPGDPKSPVAKDGFVIPASNTMPDVNLDEFLAALDNDTRDHLQLLLGGAARGPQGPRHGPRRAVPALRADRARPAPRQRGRGRRARGHQGRHPRACPADRTAVAQKDDDVAQLVDSSAAVFEAFASEDQQRQRDGSEAAGRAARDDLDARRRAALRRRARSRVHALLPTFRALDRTNKRRHADRARDHPHPARRDPPVRARGAPARQRPAARRQRPGPLAARRHRLASSASTGCSTCSRTTRTAPRPRTSRPARRATCSGWPGSTHQTANLINIDDANGPMRPVFLTGTCQTITEPGQRGAAARVPARPQRRARAAVQQPVDDVAGPAARAEAARAKNGGTSDRADRNGPRVEDGRRNPRAARGDGDLRLLLLRPAAVPVAVASAARSRSSRRATASRSPSPRRRRSPTRPTSAWRACRSAQVRDIIRDPKGNRTLATVEMDRAYAPVHKDAKAMLRQKTLLGETYVEMTLGHAKAGKIPEDGKLDQRAASSRRSSSTRCSRLFPPETRKDFQRWQANSAEAIKGRGPGPQLGAGQHRRVRRRRRGPADGARPQRRDAAVAGPLDRQRVRGADARRGPAPRVHRRQLDVAAGDRVPARGAGRVDPDLPDLPARVAHDAAPPGAPSPATPSR